MLARYNVLGFILLAATMVFYVNFPAQQAATLARSSVARSLSEGSITLLDKSTVQNLSLASVPDLGLLSLAGPVIVPVLDPGMSSGAGEDFDMHIIFYSGWKMWLAADTSGGQMPVQEDEKAIFCHVFLAQFRKCQDPHTIFLETGPGAFEELTNLVLDCPYYNPTTTTLMHTATTAPCRQRYYTTKNTVHALLDHDDMLPLNYCTSLRTMFNEHNKSEYGTFTVPTNIHYFPGHNKVNPPIPADHVTIGEAIYSPPGSIPVHPWDEYHQITWKRPEQFGPTKHYTLPVVPGVYVRRRCSFTMISGNIGPDATALEVNLTNWDRDYGTNWLGIQANVSSHLANPCIGRI